MLGCSSAAAVEEVAGGADVVIIGLHAYERVLLRVGRGGGALCDDAGAWFGRAARGWNMLLATHKKKPEKVGAAQSSS